MQDVHLIMVNGDANNNKFYDMHDNGNGTFTVTYGRVGNTGVTQEYPISKWNSLYNSKARLLSFLYMCSNSIATI